MKPSVVSKTLELSSMLYRSRIVASARRISMYARLEMRINRNIRTSRAVALVDVLSTKLEGRSLMSN